MPKLDFDTINLGHGSGGILSWQLLNSSIFDILDNPILATRHDGAILGFETNPAASRETSIGNTSQTSHSVKLAFSTDSYVVNPIFFPGGSIGDLAVNGTVNDLAMCGAKPTYLSLALILEEGLPMTELWLILCDIRKAADQAGVQIVTGDTKVVERGKGDKIYINTSGIGTVHPTANISIKAIQPGDAILLNAPIAEHGIAIMSRREGLQFETDVISDTRPLNNIVEHLLDQLGHDIHFLRDATRGGLASVLNEIARDANTGIEIRQKDIPVATQVASACELLGLDPLYVANEGAFIAIVNAEKVEQALQLLGPNGRIIGHITNEHPKQVLMKSAIGGRRVVNMLPGEQLPRIC